MIQPSRWRSAWVGALSLTGAILPGTIPAIFAQSTPSPITQPRIDRIERPGLGVAGPQHAIPASPPSAVPSDISGQSFVLRSLQLDGGTAIANDDLTSLWRARIGRSVTVAEIYAISDQIGAAYTKAGYALFRVVVPNQDFATGQIHLRVIEGFVDAVEVQGVAPERDLSLLRGYAAQIVADRPLRQATLERAILLMNAIPGTAVGSDFQPIPGGAPGAVRLRLAVVEKRFDYGVGIQNQGQNLLGQTQVTASVSTNNLLHQGDRTQLQFSAPIDFQRFQYLALTHIEPLGNDGATVTFSGADLLTHPIHNGSAGNAFLFSVTGSYPIIRGVHELLVATIGADTLNSDNAILGQIFSDERTRSIRAAATYANDLWLDGVTQVSVSLNQGLDVLGARRSSVAYGGPAYTKATFRVSREQPLPWDFVLRAKVFAQGSTGRLPSSEQFAFGGTDFGQALQAATLTADRALAGAAELAHPLPGVFNTKWNSGSEGFGFIDGAYLWNARTLYQLRYDRGATAGIGIRTKLLDKVVVQMAGATVIQRALTPGGNRGWRLVMNVTGSF